MSRASPETVNQDVRQQCYCIKGTAHPDEISCERRLKNTTFFKRLFHRNTFEWCERREAGCPRLDEEH